MQLLHSYQPSSMLRCPAVLFHSLNGQQAQQAQQAQHGPMGIMHLLGRVADDCWRQVAPALLPIAAHSLEALTMSGGGDISAPAVSPVEAVLLEATQAGVLSDHSSAANSNAERSAAAVPLNSACPELR